MSKEKRRRGRVHTPSSAARPTLPDSRLMDKSMAQITRFLQSHQFASVEEANAALQAMLTGGGLPEIAASTPLERAQDLVYQALEETGPQRQKLARRALELSPDCADAYVLLAEAARTPQEARDLYARGVQAAERALGPDFFKDNLGSFWSILETRPYMRSREGLAQALWALGEHQQAIEHLIAMLRLNPNDNQGLRYTLATWLLAEGQLAELEHLLKRYPDEWSAAWAYTRALVAFRKQGAGRSADTALRKAFEVNRFVPLYLLGIKKLPRHPPEYIGLGDENEAVDYVVGNAQNWLNSEGALEWLARTFTQNPPPSGRTSRAPS